METIVLINADTERREVLIPNFNGQEEIQVVVDNGVVYVVDPLYVTYPRKFVEANSWFMPVKAKGATHEDEQDRRHSQELRSGAGHPNGVDSSAGTTPVMREDR